MGRGKLFVRTDPYLLDQYSARLPQRRRIPWATRRLLILQTRALQCLPPRELFMLYSSQVLKVDQGDIASLLHVHQQNVSYRISQAKRRIPILIQLWETCSETEFRSVLIDLELPPDQITVILGCVKTLSQTVTRQALRSKTLDWKWKSMRQRLAAKIAEMGDDYPERYQRAQRLVDLAEANWNGLGITPQARYHHKLTYSTSTKKIPRRRSTQSGS